MSTTTTTLLDGFNHVAVVTRDLDRLAAFYGEAFDVELQERHSPRGRHGFLALGPACFLHAFEVPEAYTGPFPAEDMMRRGRLDHIALGARDEAALAEVRRRLVALGATDGTLTRFGDMVLSLYLEDPDGMQLEVACPVSGDVFGPADYDEFEE